MQRLDIKLPDAQKQVIQLLADPLLNQLAGMNNTQIDAWVDEQVKGIKETNNLLKLLTKGFAALARMATP